MDDPMAQLMAAMELIPACVVCIIAHIVLLVRV